MNKGIQIGGGVFGGITAGAAGLCPPPTSEPEHTPSVRVAVAILNDAVDNLEDRVRQTSDRLQLVLRNTPVVQDNNKTIGGNAPMPTVGCELADAISGLHARIRVATEALSSLCQRIEL